MLLKKRGKRRMMARNESRTIKITHFKQFSLKAFYCCAIYVMIKSTDFPGMVHAL